jgi:hypothetical protein
MFANPFYPFQTPHRFLSKIPTRYSRPSNRLRPFENLLWAMQEKKQIYVILKIFFSFHRRWKDLKI